MEKNIYPFFTKNASTSIRHQPLDPGSKKWTWNVLAWPMAQLGVSGFINNYEFSEYLLETRVFMQWPFLWILFDFFSNQLASTNICSKKKSNIKSHNISSLLQIHVIVLPKALALWYVGKKRLNDAESQSMSVATQTQSSPNFYTFVGF